jgi:hypothetical protein
MNILGGIETVSPKRLFIGPAAITVNKIELKEVAKNQYSNVDEARFDIYYDLVRNSEKLIDNGMFSFFVSSDINKSATGKTQFITDSAQFIWSESEALAKKGFKWNDSVMTNPSDNVYPAYKKMEVFINMLCAMVNYNIRATRVTTGAFDVMNDKFLFSELFTDTAKIQKIFEEFSEEINTPGTNVYNKVRVMFLVDAQGRQRIDTKNNESFAFATNESIEQIKKAIIKKLGTQYPFISGTYSLKFQEYDPSKVDVYAKEILELGGVSEIEVDEW